MKLILSLFLFASFSTSAFASLGKVVGQLGLVEGDVLVDAKAVKKNASVREGSVIEVKKGRATLLLGQGTVFNLASDSRMVVTQFGVKPGTGDEEGDLNLNFGRTRALILNQAGERKEIKIRARAATMGVRGTEIFINAPKDSNESIQFFTLEGKADVMAHPGAPLVPVNQNQGVSAKGGEPSAVDGSKAGSNEAIASTVPLSEIKAELKREKLDSVNIQIPPPLVTTAAPGTLSGQLGIGSLPPIRFDPIQDRFLPLSIQPRFCSATTGTCN